jgi:hypothetical protein
MVGDLWKGTKKLLKVKISELSVLIRELVVYEFAHRIQTCSPFDGN